MFQNVALWVVPFTKCCIVGGLYHKILHYGWFTLQNVALWVIYLTICCIVGGSSYEMVTSQYDNHLFN